MRLLGAVSVAAMAFGLLPISPAAAAIDANDACANSAEDGFTDTGPEDADDLPNDVEDAVDCLAACDITVGQFGSLLFGTGNNVTRGQLASFVMNILDRVDNFDRPGNAFDQFPDDEDSVHERNINDAAALGIVRGYPDGTYRPSAPVSRAQMATFLVNTLEEAGVEVPGTTNDAFTDDEQSVHESNINRLEALDIVDGESAGIYNPERSVTRGTMAFFLTRTYELIVEDGLADPCGGNETLAVSPQGDATIVCTDPTIESDDTTDQRTYTVSGLNQAEDFRITLVDADNVSTDADGNTVFEEDASTGLALAGTVAARIVRINGTDVTTPAQTFGAVVPVGGVITFVVDCGGAERVTPVIYEDQGASTRLELDDDGRPTEEFGTGGTITFAALPAVQDAVTVTSAESGAQGDTFPLTVTSDDITDVASVTVSGDCVDTETFLAGETTTDSLVLDVMISDEAALGDCELTVVTTFTADSALTPESDVVTIEVTDGIAPNLTSSVPEDEATGVSVTANLTATFDETLATGSTATLTCGGTNVAGASTFTGATITFNPAADLADVTACVVTFTAVDPAGNTTSETVAFVTADTTDPTLVSSVPDDEATGVSLTANLSATFSETLATGSEASLACDGDDVAGASTFTGATITFNPTGDLPGLTACVATFTAVDAAGNLTTETVAFVTVAQNAVAVTAEGPAVQGGDFPLTVTSAAIDDVDLVTVTGDCVDDQPFLPGGGSTEDSLEFAVEVAPDAPVGACVLTVVTSFTDESGLQDETDTVTVTITADTTAPNMTTASGAAATDTLTVTFSEPVACAAGAAAQFGFVAVSGGTPVSPSTATCNGTATVTLVFADGALVAGPGGAITYTDGAGTVNDVRDLSGNSALTETIAAPVT